MYVKSTIWNDEPSAADGLGRSEIASALSHVITSCETPLVVGLYGTWGSGKTSLLRLIEADLERSAAAITVWFDAWQHQFDENPAIALLHKMVIDLNIGEEGKRLLFSIAGALGEIVLKRTSGLTVKDLRELQRQYDEERFAIREKQIRLRHSFEELIRKATNDGAVRVVFFVDDLDRCLPENILKVLEALKLFLNLPGCVYVLGVDRQALEGCIRQRYPGTELNEAAYLDKIVQLPFTIPRISSDAARHYIEELLPEKLDTATDLLVRGLGQNPRQIKRFANSFTLNNSLATLDYSIKHDPRVLAAVLLVQLRYPGVYQELLVNPQLLDQPKDEWQSDPVIQDALRFMKNGDQTLLKKYIDLSEITAVVDGSSSVVLGQAGDKKVQIIKEVRAYTGLGLKEAKDVVESAPVTVASGMPRERAEAFAEALRAVGATVEIV